MADEKKEEAKPAAAVPALAPASPGSGGDRAKYMKYAKIGGGVLVLLIALYFGLSYFGLLKSSAPEYHVHADFKVFIEGKPYNFSLAKYQENEACGNPDQIKNPTLKDFVHVHDGNGDVVHVHKQGITWGDFFESIGMKLNVTCLVLDTKEPFCDNENNTLKMYVNGQLNTEMERQPIRDLDRMLLSYGPEDQDGILRQMGTVTNDACIYSGSCKERGVQVVVENCGS